jgi:hypothetical protein
LLHAESTGEFLGLELNYSDLELVGVLQLATLMPYVSESILRLLLFQHEVLQRKDQPLVSMRAKNEGKGKLFLGGWHMKLSATKVADSKIDATTTSKAGETVLRTMRPPPLSTSHVCVCCATRARTTATSCGTTLSGFRRML